MRVFTASRLVAPDKITIEPMAEPIELRVMGSTRASDLGVLAANRVQGEEYAVGERTEFIAISQAAEAFDVKKFRSMVKEIRDGAEHQYSDPDLEFGVTTRLRVIRKRVWKMTSVTDNANAGIVLRWGGLSFDFAASGAGSLERVTFPIEVDMDVDAINR